MARTDGTVWGEVGPIPIFSYYHSPILILSFPIPRYIQLSGLDEAIELAELESQFAFRKSKGQQLPTPTPSLLSPLTHPPYSHTHRVLRDCEEQETYSSGLQESLQHL